MSPRFMNFATHWRLVTIGFRSSLTLRHSGSAAWTCYHRDGIFPHPRLRRPPLGTSVCASSSVRGRSDRATQGEELSFDEELKQLSLLQRYKKLAKEYWYVLIPVHCCTSILWFSTCLAVVYA